MKQIIIILCLVLLSGCGSSSKSTDQNKSANQSEFDWVSNSDFDEVKEIEYLKRNDVYEDNSGKSDVLSLETLSRATKQHVQLMVSSKDPISKSVSYCYQGKFKKAFKIFDQNYLAYKNNPGYWNQVGTCYFLKKELRKAVLFYHRAKIKDKNYVPAINNMGVIYLYQNRDQEALKSFKIALKVQQGAKTPRFNIAQIYLKYGKVKEAEDIVSSLRDAAPDDVDINTLLGTIELYKRDYSRSTMYFNFIPQTELWRADISLNFSLAQFYSNNKVDAHKTFNFINTAKLGPLKSYYGHVKGIIGR